MPNRGSHSLKSLFVPPYVSRILTTRSPRDSSENSVPLIAAIPVEKLVAASPPSSSRSFSSNTATVGFVFRE
jgi:hypothetical protein